MNRIRPPGARAYGLGGDGIVPVLAGIVIAGVGLTVAMRVDRMPTRPAPGARTKIAHGKRQGAEEDVHMPSDGAEPRANPSDVNGRRLAMVACGEKPDGSADVVVFAGPAEWDGDHLSMHHESSQSSLVLPDEFLGRLQPVPSDLRSILLDADYSLSVTIGDLPADADPSEYVRIGLMWPKDEEG